VELNIKPVEHDGTHWIRITLGDQEWKQLGPFPDAGTAAAKANQLARNWGGIPNQPAVDPSTTSNDVILHGKSVELGSSEGYRFVVDCVRAAEGLITDNNLQKKYEISPKNWKNIDKNPALITAIRDERERRVRNGQAAREKAAQSFVRAPAVMSTIMDDKNANPRHRIEAALEIRATATGGGDESTPDTSERFVITINLGADHIERIEKEITPRKSPQMIEGEANADE
jgi:hypothetical protein